MPIAGYAVGQQKDVLYTVVGSCVAIMLYDPVKKIGGMIHIMLGYAKNDGTVPSKYADTGIPFLISKMIEAGASAKHLKGAKIVGGGNMFKATSGEMNVALQNVQAVRHELGKRDIKIIQEDCGGRTGRRVLFFLATGKLEIESQNPLLDE